MKEISTSVLCIKCKKSLDDISNIRKIVRDDDDFGTNPNQRYKCESYRILLPNLKGKIVMCFFQFMTIFLM